MSDYRNTPKTTPDGMKDWQHWENVGHYSVWCRQDGCDTIWQVTNGEKPYPYSGGYYNRESMLKLKGLV